MKNTMIIFAMTGLGLGLSACQSLPEQNENSFIGYKVESKTDRTAVLVIRLQDVKTNSAMKVNYSVPAKKNLVRIKLINCGF